jgi:hypothetical protein
MCNFCRGEFYVKTVRYTMPLLAPTTRAEGLRQELINITGEEFTPIVHIFCPVCGDKVGEDK